ncbi:MAG: Jag N-terminal domain-containing protein [Clostridia bacterium]|nr:Jag N-terminal domain-containing protein [Clostridia bacterium]
MSNSREFTGKTTEEAIEKGLREMGVTFSDVRIETLQEGSKGLFGLFGSRPAKVRITLNEESTDLKDLVHDMFASAQKAPKQEKPREKKEPAPEKAPGKPKEKTEKPADKPAEEDAEKTEKPVEKAAPQPAADENAPEKKPGGRKKPEGRKNAQDGEKKGEQRKKNQGEGRKKAPKPQEPKAPRAPVEQLDPATKAGQAQVFLQELTRLMGVDVSVEVSTDEEGNIRVNMEGDTLGILIGRRGETLDALQYLTSLKVNKGQNEYTRVTLDTEHYRAKREEALVRLANRMANRVQKTGRKVSMEPMNPYERRILHSALQNNEFVTTHSEGEEPNRHVVITPKKAEKGEKTAKSVKARAGSPAAENDADEVDVKAAADITEAAADITEAAAVITEAAAENTETAQENA